MLETGQCVSNIDDRCQLVSSAHVKVDCVMPNDLLRAFHAAKLVALPANSAIGRLGVVEAPSHDTNPAWRTN